MFSSMLSSSLAAVGLILLAYTPHLGVGAESACCSDHSPPTTMDLHDASLWQTLNNATVQSSDNGNGSSFSLTTPPATDLWRPNATSVADNFTAPFIYRTLKASQFKSISVTVDADWKTRHDQGGIAVIFPDSKPYKWIKTGIEFENAAPQLGTVATYAFSDWSLSPVVPKGATKVRFVLERSTTEAWIYSEEVDAEAGERYPLREVTWAFLEERGGEDVEIWVGLYAAKPTYTEGNFTEGLRVEFRDLGIVVC